MARNRAGGRRGSVRGRSQFARADGHWVKRDAATGRILAVKADLRPWKGVRKERPMRDEFRRQMFADGVAGARFVYIGRRPAPIRELCDACYRPHAGGVWAYDEPAVSEVWEVCDDCHQAAGGSVDDQVAGE